MQDQVNSFCAKGARAELLSSAQPAAERRRVLADLDAPQPTTQLLFVTPELLDAGGGFIQKLQWLYSSGGCPAVAHRGKALEAATQPCQGCMLQRSAVVH